MILLNNVLGLILHQRGYSVLQAGAVLIENQCYAFAGTTGCGKSTLMAAFHQRGYQVVSDGICALCLVENRPPRILPGYPFIQAWKETFKALQIDPGQCKRVRPELEKWLYPTFANCKTLEIQVFAGKTRYFLCMEYMDYLIKISGTRIPCGQPVDFALRAKSTA